MTYKLISIDPPEILTVSPVVGKPVRREFSGDPAEMVPPEGCVYLPESEQERPIPNATQRLVKLPDAIVVNEVHTNRWEVVDFSAAEIAARDAAASRKVWPSVAEFYAEFWDTEQYGIQTSTSPSIIVARGQLAMWRGDVWSDDPRIVGGLDALVAAGIIDAERRAQILQSPA